MKISSSDNTGNTDYIIPNGAIEQETQEGFDIKKFLFTNVLNILPFIILSVLVGLFGSFLVNRYTKPVYSVEGTMLLQEEQNKQGLGSSIQSIFFSDSRLIFENSLLVLKSYELHARVIKDSEFNTSYYTVGRAVSNEVFGVESPVKIVFDTVSPQPLGGVIIVESVDDNKYIVSMPQVGINSMLNTQEPVKVKDCEYPAGEKKYGEWIQSSCYKFKIISTKSFSKGAKVKIVLNKNKDVVNAFRKNLQLDALSKGSAGVSIKLQGNSREKMKAYINKLQDIFMEVGLEEKNKIAQSAIHFIESQLSTISDSLQLVEDHLEKFRVNKNAIDLSAQGGLLLTRLNSILEERAQIKLQTSYLNYLSEYINKKDYTSDLIAPSLIGIESDDLRERIQKLVDLQIEFKKTKQTGTDINPIYKKQLEAINQYSAGLLEVVKNMQQSVKIAEDEVETRLGKLQSEINLLPSKEREFFVIQRKFMVNEGIYNFLLQRRAELGILKASTKPDNKIIDRASVKEKISPQSGVNFLTGGLLGAILPILIISIIEFFNNKIRSTEDIKKITNIPVIGGIGHSDKETNLVVYNNPKSSVSEQFRAIRSSLQFLSGEKQNNLTILITSSISGEGKTFCSINTASILAFGATPIMPFPLLPIAAIVPAQWVP